MTAIETVARLGKPLVEIGLRNGDPADLEDDLKSCLAQVRDGTRVAPWIRQQGQYWRFGFYGEPWVLRALDFLDDPDLAPRDRHWISGLLFGYSANAIQRFIEANRDRAAEPISSLSPTRSENSAGTDHPSDTALARHN